MNAIGQMVHQVHVMHICMSGQQKNLVYALWQGVPKLVYPIWTCKPVQYITCIKTPYNKIQSLNPLNKISIQV